MSRHSRIRETERKFALQNRRSALPPPRVSASGAARQILRSERKSESGSAKALCAAAAASFASSGRSRGSGTLSPAAMISISGSTFSCRAWREHAAERGIDGEPREFVAERREFVPIVQRAELVEQRVAGANGGSDGGVEKRERLDIAEPERLHAQDDFREIRPLDLRLREARALREIFLRIEPDAGAILHAPRTARALVRAALRDVLDRQPLGPRARIVAAHAGKPGIDHIANARQGERSLRDVRGHDHAAARARREDALLLGGGHAPEKPDHLEARAEAAFQHFARVANVALRGHKDEDVAHFRLDQRILGRAHRRLDVAEFVGAFFRAGVAFDRRVANLHGPQPAETSMIGAPPNAFENASVSIVAEVMMSFRSPRWRSRPCK